MRCEHAGFLQKLSCGQLSAKWRRRWFQLQVSSQALVRRLQRQQRLSCGVLQDDSTLLSFNGTTCVSSLPLANACVRERASNDTFEFEVLTATRLYVLRADSEREMHRWLAAIASRTDAFHENASIDYCQIIIDEATFERNDRADLLVAATFDAKQPQS